MRPNGRDGLADRVGRVGAGVGTRNGRRGEDWRAVGGVARRDRRAVQRARQDRPQLVAILGRQPSQQLEALRGRRLAGQFDDLLRFASAVTGEPFGGLHSLIQIRALALCAARHRDQFAARDREVQLNKLAPAARGATHLEGQVDSEILRPSKLPDWPGFHAGRRFGKRPVFSDRDLLPRSAAGLALPRHRGSSSRGTRLAGCSMLHSGPRGSGVRTGSRLHDPSDLSARRPGPLRRAACLHSRVPFGICSMRFPGGSARSGGSGASTGWPPG